jgi:D-galactose 1-dehydrogenase
MSDLRIAIVGFGKIARDQHVPAIAATPGAKLVAVASRNASLPDVPHFRSLEELLRDGPEIDAVALCMPPQVRRVQAATALAARKHVMLEKPPGASVSEIAPLVAAAKQAGVSLFATWHSRYAPAVEPARQLLAGRRINQVTITWKEDVRVWHPGQDWIFEAGGFGVFDPGINALSILTHILPEMPVLVSARLSVPRGRASPLLATMDLRSGNTPVSVDLDFLQEGPQRWDIEVDTPDGMLRLSHGGATLSIANVPVPASPNREYPRLYARFADLISAHESDVDLAPLQLVIKAIAIGEHVETEPFAFERGTA